MIPFLQRKRSQCCWPVEGEGKDMKVCGDPVYSDSYCSKHHYTAYRMGTDIPHYPLLPYMREGYLPTNSYRAKKLYQALAPILDQS